MKGSIQSGNQAYPLFIGFSSARSLSQIAEAPSFSNGTSHADICTNVLTPPVKDWQRPISSERVAQISQVYNLPGELMPNPVLLCENTSMAGQMINISQAQSNGVPLDSWNVAISPSQQMTPKPLWILDGQHRINGLANSAQADNPLPVVLLLNHGGVGYSGPVLAKIFAQVTTEATRLADLHNEWLTFAFKLGNYAMSSTIGDASRKSMEAVAEMCRRPHLSTNTTPNPFWNRIKFNDYSSANIGPAQGGFRYNCIELKELISRYYYNAPSPFGPHLSPVLLGDEIATAYAALFNSVRAPHDDSVFFGDSKHEQRIMQDSFLAAVMTAVRQRGPGQNWLLLLSALAFPTTDWNFHNWVNTLNGQAGTLSKKLATKVFCDAFVSQQLPTANGNLADYLKGNDASIAIVTRQLNPNGRPTRRGEAVHSIRGGNVRTINLQSAGYVLLNNLSGNIAKAEIIDAESAPGNPVSYTPGGFMLPRVPLPLVVKFHHYGGTESSAKITLST